MKSNKDIPPSGDLSAEESELLEYLLEQEGVESSEHHEIAPRKEQSEAPLSFAQERVWFLDQFQPNSSLYLSPAPVRLTGRLNMLTLKQSIDSVIQRHEIFRSSYPADNGRPVQIIASELSLPLTIIDLSALPEENKESIARKLASEDAARPFSLSQPPLIRSSLIILSDLHHLLLLTMHHIISDGWSAGVLVREVASLYPSFCSGSPSPLPPLPIQYADFALWQRSSLSGSSLDLLLDFWHHRLADAPPLLLLPTDRPRLPFPSLTGSRLPFSLPNDLSVRLKALSHKEGATLFITLLAAFKLLLHLYSHQADVLVGTRIAGRTRLETEPLIGFFVNALVLRTDLSGNPSFRQILARVRDSALSAYSHQELPFEELVKHLQPERSLAHSPLFNVMFALQNAPFPRLRLPDLEIAPLRMDSFTSKYDLDFTLWEEGGGLRGWIEYSTELFSNKSMAEFASRFERLVERVLADPDIKVDSLELMSDDDRLLIDEFNNTQADYPSDLSLHQLFEKQAEAIPDHIALITVKDIQWVYEELRSGKISPENLGNCCFKENPFIHRYEDFALLTIVESIGLNPDEFSDMTLLRTHKTNLAVVDKGTLRLLDHLDGRSNLKSLISRLDVSDIKLVAYTVSLDTDSGSEGFLLNSNSYAFLFDKKEFQIGKDLESWTAYIQYLINSNLVEIVDFNQAEKSGDIIRLNGKRAEPPSAEPEYADNGPGGNITAEWTNVFAGDVIETLAGEKQSPVLLLGGASGLASMGIVQLAAFLQRHGIEAYCQLNDLNNDQASLESNIRELLSRIKPKVVGVSFKWFLHLAREIEICRLIKLYAPDVKVVIGGDTATHFAEDLIKYDFIDYVALGDGEVPLMHICMGAKDVPNCIYKKNGEIVRNSIAFALTQNVVSKIYLSHLDEVFTSNADIFSAPFVYIPTGRGCPMNCGYCSAARETQIEVFGRPKPYASIRGFDNVRSDITLLKKYTSTFMFSFDLPVLISLDYYRELWQGLDLKSHFALFDFWFLPSAEFVDLVANTFNYVYMSIDLGSLAEQHRLQLTKSHFMKPQPTDEQVFEFFEAAQKYNNVEVTINSIVGLPYFKEEDAKSGLKFLDHLLANYPCFSGLEWARLAAHPGAPIVKRFTEYGMKPSASTFEDFYSYSKRSLDEPRYAALADLHRPFVYYEDDRLNSVTSKYYAEGTKRTEEHLKQRNRHLTCKEEISYGDLNQRANQLAHHLISLGVGPEIPVALFLHRSIDFILSLIAILKAGGVYIPIDPSLPSSLISDMLSISNPSIIISDTALASVLPDYPASLVLLDRDHLLISQSPIDNPLPRACPDNLSHIVFSSGSTGLPKPIAVSHHQLLNRCSWMLNLLPFSSSDLLAQRSSASFSVSLWEFFGPLLAGSTALIIPDLVAKDLDLLVESLSVNKATRITVVPSLLRALLDSDIDLAARLPHLLLWSVCGEPLSPDLANLFHDSLPEATLINQYGASEVNDIAFYLTPAHTQDCTSVPLGRPVQNTRIYLLDDSLQIVPPGIPGNLFVSTPGLARCYLNQADLTAERFIPDPFSSIPGARLYDSRDRAKLTMEGLLEYAGRTDHQVKVRGMSVDLKGIESVIKQQPDIKDAAVVARQDKPGLLSIVAYVVAKEGSSVTAAQVKRHVAERMAGYCVPEAVVKLKQMPLTASGKLDRRSLPEQEQVVEAEDGLVQAAASAVEQVLEAIWCDVLGVEEVGRETSFFDLGGHSLLATKLISRVKQVFHVEMGLRSVFESPTIRGLGEKIEAAIGGGRSPEQEAIRRAGRDEQLPLSFAQQRLWFLDQLEPGNAFYNCPIPVRLSGRLKMLTLEQTLNEIIRRHEALRTSFPAVEGRPVQVIAPRLSLAMPVVDLCGLSETMRNETARGLAGQEAMRPFDLAAGPLARAHLLRLDSDNNLLLLDMHHIVSDGWSNQVLVRETVSLYESFTRGVPSTLADLPIQYADYAVAQRESFEADAFAAQLAYWKEQLGGAITVLELPTDKPRPPVRSNRGASEGITLDATLSRAIKQLARSEQATLYMAMLAAWQTLLHRYTSQDDILIGTPVAGRNRSEVEGLIGFFVNTLVLRTDLAGDPSFRALLTRVREVVLKADAHQDVPFEKLVDELQPDRDMSLTPLFQVWFVLHNAARAMIELPALKINTSWVETEAVQFDLSLIVAEAEDRLGCYLTYNTDLFERATIKRMLGHFHQLLLSIMADPDQAISRLPILAEDELNRLVVEWNSDGPTPAECECIHQVFEAQVKRQPESTAIIFEGGEHKYGDLNRRANRLARYLRRVGVGPERIAGVYLERSPQVILSLLAILKAGGVYLPLDVEHPQERLSFMLNDSRPEVIITEQHLIFGLPVQAAASEIVCLDSDWDRIAEESDDDPASVTTGGNLAYVIYTSGSTGTPKGVSISHGAAVSHVASIQKEFELSATDRVLQFSSLSFDVSLEQILPTLASGATVVLRGNHAWGAAEMLSAIEDHKLTVINPPTAYWHQIAQELSDGAQEVSNKGLRLVIAGGETMLAESARLWKQTPFGAARLLNAYGPTEAAITSTFFDVPGDFDAGRRIPIGRPIGGRALYILDRAGFPVPVGIQGELHIGGGLLARGYLNRPDLTAEMFIPDAFSREPGARLYKTGDLARYLQDGSVEFLGRRDHQVKLRGFRIELGEVEAALASHPDVRAVAAVVREDRPGNKQLVAYVAGDPAQDISGNDLRNHLEEKLPEYMIPSTFMIMESLPLTATGKIDRRALPIPDSTRPDAEETYLAPRGETEEMIAAIFSEILGIERIGINDNFFALGGHSLVATQVMSRIRDAFQISMPLRIIFEHPTVAEMAIATAQLHVDSADAGEISELLAELEGLSEEDAQMLLAEQGDGKGAAN